MPLSVASLLRLEGGRGVGAAGQLREKAFLPVGFISGDCSSSPLSPPTTLVLLTDSYLSAGGHAPQQPTADKMLM